MKHIHLLLSCTCLLLSATAPVRADIQSEATALVNWKASLADADGSLESWSLANSTSLCRWSHITCEPEAGHITELNLIEASLKGTLDKLDFSAFPHLKKLILLDNDLYGNIPAGISNLTSLVHLKIINNPYLKGSIPRSIGQLKHLVVLDLKALGLDTTLPEEIGNCTSLKGLTLWSVTLTGSIPLEIGMLTKLRFLDLSNNNLTGSIPLAIGNMTELQSLLFFGNYLEGQLPRSISHLIKLQLLVLYGNQLGGTLLTEQGEIFLCNSTDLHVLDLSNNALDGTLSKCLWDMPSLYFIHLSSNSFTGIVPFSRTRKDSLNYLLLGNNYFRGTFPLGLKKCKSLITLDLGRNHFSGTIPSWVSMSFPRLEFLVLSSNIFDGIIPQQILQFRRLQLLDLSKNRLTGPIPDDFTNFTGMIQEQENIDTYNYTVFGRDMIEIVWKNADRVYNLWKGAVVGMDLSGNFLSQAIPDGLTTLHALRFLNLSGNHLSGSIPQDFGNLELLESLDLSQNQLSGGIPSSFAALKSMSVLNLSYNGLSGRIPTGSQLQTLVDPSIYSHNPGLCGFPLEDCVNSSTSTQNEVGQAGDREVLWLYCFVAAGFISGFWLYWGMFMFYSETWRCVFHQYVDNMQGKVTKKMYSCMSRFQGGGP